MARTAPLTDCIAASLALHALGLWLVAAMPKESPARAESGSAAIVARLVEPEAPQRQQPKPAPKKRVAVEKAAPPAPPVEETLSVAQFRQQFISSAARHLDYPRAAQSNQAEGEVVVGVSLAAGAVAVSVKRSSGHELLDEQALEMLRRAAARMPVPSSLRGQAFAFEVPVVYALKR
jgi:protein TonB